MRSIAVRLTLAFLCIICLLAVQGIFAVFNARHVAEVQREALSRELAVTALREKIADARLAVFQLLGTMNPSEMDRFRAPYSRDMLEAADMMDGLEIDTRLLTQCQATYDRIIALQYDFSGKTARALMDGQSREEHGALERLLAVRAAEIARNVQTRIAEVDRVSVFVAAGLCAVALAIALTWAILLARSVTDRRRADRTLRESEQRFRELAEHIREVFWMATPDHARFIYVSPAFEKTWGRTREELYTRPQLWLDAVHPDDREIVERCARHSAEADLDGEYRIIRPDGSVRWIHDRGFPIRNQAGQVYRLAGIAEDVTARKQAEEALQESEAALKATLESTQDGVLVVNRDGSVSHWNQRFEELWSIPPEVLEPRHDPALIDYVLPQLVDPDGFTARITQLYETSEASEDVIELCDGRAFERRSTPLIRSGCEQGRVWFFRDITYRRRAQEERSKLEAQLRQAQKMEAVGQLAGGVAHDFNNILTAILGNAELALRQLRSQASEDQKLIEELHQIEHGAHRAASLTRQLLAFSRRQVIHPEILDLNERVRHLEPMLRRLITEHVTLNVVLAPELAHIRADGGQLEQIIMNLVVNACDAMTDGGLLTIETANTRLGERDLALHTDARPGDYVQLAVSDTGQGMDAKTLDHIFEPFFTTKDRGKGTGLGLATVYGIVTQADGHVGVQSESGQGTTFRVYLPVVETNKRAAIKKPVQLAAPAGSETLLVCEDDEMVRRLTVQMLQSAGYNVLCAGSGDEAIKTAEGSNEPIHLLITDVIMQDMNGRSLANSLIARRPGLRTLFMSGYTADVIGHHGVLEDGVQFIEKPFTRHALLQRVRSSLDVTADHPDATTPNPHAHA